MTADTLQLDPLEAVSLTILVDNVVDSWLPNQGPARRPVVGGSAPRVSTPLLTPPETVDPLRAEHGFSALVRFNAGGRVRSILFDAGRTPDGLIENMRRLQISPHEIEAIVFSHGHFDHTTGLHGLVHAVGRPSVPVVVHPGFWSRRRFVFASSEPFELPSTSRTALQAVGFEVIEERNPSLLLDGAVLVTGEIDRSTAYERGFPGHEALRAGAWLPDPLILDEQALVMRVRGKGLVIVTGCGHAGVVNTVRHVQRLTGGERVHALIGGFHLGGPLFEPLIPPVCRALTELRPDVIVPTHCTGWRAVHALAAALPDAFIQSSVGTTLEL